MEPFLTGHENTTVSLRDELASRAAFVLFGASILTGLATVPVLLFQALIWLRHGVWKPLSLREQFHVGVANTAWAGVNVILNRLAEGELAGALLAIAAAT